MSASRGAIGFVGLGNMGQGMVRNLLAAGFPVLAHDIDPGRAQAAAGAGAQLADSPAVVAAECRRTISMVATTAQAETVIGELGVGGRAGDIVVSMSTIEPARNAELQGRLAARSIELVDAPVSGGRAKADSGELSVMAGGNRAAYEACRDLFAAIARQSFYIGPSGQGLAMKLVNNMLVHVNLVTTCEALLMGVKGGLDPETMYEVISASLGTSAIFETRVPKILARRFDEPSGTIDIAYKDQELTTAFAKQLGVPVLLANVSQQVYQMARAAGLGDQDSSAFVQVLEQLAGAKLERRT